MAPPPTLVSLLSDARARRFRQTLAEDAVTAASAGLAGFFLLTLTGTKVLPWWWPLLVAAAVLGWRVWRSWQRLPDLYRVSQDLDRRLGLKDLLSTAFHFTQHPQEARKAEWVDAVAAQASVAAQSVSLPAVHPWRKPRMTLAAVGLLALTGGGLAVRYGILRSLDLAPPLLAVQWDPLNRFPETPQSSRKPKSAAAPLEAAGFVLPEADKAAQEANERAIEEQLRALQVETIPDPASQDPNSYTRTASPEVPGEEGQPESAQNSPLPKNASLSTGENAPNSGAQSKQPPRAPESNSLLEKMRDAMANLMEKLKLDPQGDSPREASAQDGQGREDRSQQAQNQKGKPGDQKQQPAQGDPDQQGDDSSSQASDAQNAQMAKNSQNNEQASNNQKSGIGKSDGSKEVELAEQLEAMGKLSELLSRRAEKVQGEMMVEVSSTRNQQARTAFTGREGERSGAGGELLRNEVPLHLQPYVQKYYELVRKPAPRSPAP